MASRRVDFPLPFSRTNSEGGSQNYRFATRASESSLGEYLTIRWGVDKPRSRFFLRAETYYNVATETPLKGSGSRCNKVVGKR